MNESNKQKLKNLIVQRVQNMKAIRQFDELFYRFSNFTLKEIIKEINFELEASGTDDMLKLFYDDPYSNKRNPYFVLVQLFFKSNRFDYFLDNTKNNPALLFEGSEFNGKVKISFKIHNDENFKLYKEVPIQSLESEESEETFNVLLTFIENVYKK